jgi:hypothetical protein
LSCPIVPKIVAPIAEQDAYESRNLWQKVTEALLSQDYDKASIEKTTIEDNQRAMTKLREQDNVEWRPKFFRRSRDGFWHFVDRNALLQSPAELYDELHEFFIRHYGLGARFGGHSARS